MAFFRKRDAFFTSPNLKKKIFQKAILNLKFKFQAQDSFLEYFFWRFGDLKKRIALSEKKPTLACISLGRLSLASWQFVPAGVNKAAKVYKTILFLG